MRWCLSALGLSICLVTGGSAEEFTLVKAQKLGEGFSDKIAEALDPHGVEVAGKDGPVCTVWLAKSVVMKPKFKPSLNVKYPLTAGQLVGAMQVHAESFSDFRGQPVKAGMYTLRYGQQPADGNHVGTSELADFLLAVPADGDNDPAPTKVTALMKRSAKATGSNHPAIYSLLPPEGEIAEEPKLTHDADKELWILDATATGRQGDMETKIPFRVVVLGKSEG